MTASGQSPLSEEILAHCAERAPIYDRDNRFCSGDFEELRAVRYLLLAVPKELGGFGISLAQVAQEQRRLAYHAPATALGLNMHLYWTGVAGDLWRAGDKSLEWLLTEAAAGEIFAAGHAESGNDLPLLLSTTKAEREDGGYRFTGRKSFGSLTPVWTRLGLHAMDSSNPTAPKIVHAFMPRDTNGYSIKETWDVLGMRATRSDDTVYYGLAQRALDWTIDNIKTKTSIGLSRSMAYHAEVQHAVAEMVIEMESIGPHLDKVVADWSHGVDYGHAWGSKIVAAKYRVVQGAWRIVDTAMELADGFGIFKVAGLERLFRDARLGRIHPANSFLTHEFVAKAALGINPDEQPRWG